MIRVFSPWPERSTACTISPTLQSSVRRWSPNQPRIDVFVKFALAKAGVWVWWLQKYMKNGERRSVPFLSMNDTAASTSVGGNGLRQTATSVMGQTVAELTLVVDREQGRRLLHDGGVHVVGARDFLLAPAEVHLPARVLRDLAADVWRLPTARRLQGGTG